MDQDKLKELVAQKSGPVWLAPEGAIEAYPESESQTTMEVAHCHSKYHVI